MVEIDDLALLGQCFDKAQNSGWNWYWFAKNHFNYSGSKWQFIQFLVEGCYIDTVLFDSVFAKAFFGSDWEGRLEELLTCSDRISFIASQL